MIRSSILLGALLLSTEACFVIRRTSPAPRRTPAQQRADSIEAAMRAAGLKPYSTVIPKTARTRAGLFTTHQVGDTLYFEIPRSQFGRDMLLVGRFARAAGGGAFGGDQFTQRVLRWERDGNRVFLRSISYELTADSTLPVYQAVSQASYPPIVAVFNVLTYAADSAAVIDVTRLYTTSVPEFTAARGNLDERRSFVQRVIAFPENIEVEATQTYTPDLPSETPRPPGAPMPAVSVLAHWSMIRLPARPMMQRLFDRRVGFYSVNQTDFGTQQHRSVTRSFITRWRLEKRYRDSAMSEAVKPIVYYVDPATPKQWVPWIKRGVEEWQPAFEAAGFRNAIVARDAPSSSQDPDWSAEDIRNTVIRWLPSTGENAEGPHVHDPRSGEILNGSVRIYHNVMNLARNWYFTQVAPLDPRAQRLPFPDSLMGRLLQYVVAHEVGHTLGFQHNMKASSTYPADSVRNASFVRRMGHTPSIMDYARFNYVAQPEDRIAPADLVPRVGPYDRFAAMWGYRPVRGARTPEDEKPMLNSWAEMQDSIPWYRFSTWADRDVDPGDQMEAVGDADAVRSTALGLRNVRRVVPLLIPATLRPGEDDTQLRELYERLVEQWGRELMHVVALVGGAESRERYGSQLGPRFIPLPRTRQKDAVRFLGENAFRTPRFLMDLKILRRIEPEGALARVSAAQARILGALLDNDRLTRMTEFEALAPENSYSPGEMLTDVRTAVWSELTAARVEIDPFRRALQRAWLEQANAKVNPVPTVIFTSSRARGGLSAAPASANTDARALMRGELMQLDRALAAALARAGNRTTRLHMVDARERLAAILDPGD